MILAVEYGGVVVVVDEWVCLGRVDRAVEAALYGVDEFGGVFVDFATRPFVRAVGYVYRFVAT